MSSTSGQIVIRRVQVVEQTGGHHGGGWKVAYADFMTALMAFFLLLWILSSSDEARLKGIAEYFTDATMPGGTGVLDGASLGPPGTLAASNGATQNQGSDLGTFDDNKAQNWKTDDNSQALVATDQTEVADQASSLGSDKVQEDPSNTAQNYQLHQDEKERFDDLVFEIRQAMQTSEDLRPLMENVIFAQTPEGLQIQVVDQDGQPMFSSGSVEMSKSGSLLLEQLGVSLASISNKMVISGHTDSSPFADSTNYDNWDLSSDRANAMRRVFVKSGVNQNRILRVSGKADSEPLLENEPDHASNRRITVLISYQARMKAELATEHDTTVGSDSKPLFQAHERDHADTSPTDGQVTSQDSLRDKSELDPAVFANLRSALQ
jgi:chemotaxis protein MotB